MRSTRTPQRYARSRLGLQRPGAQRWGSLAHFVRSAPLSANVMPQQNRLAEGARRSSLLLALIERVAPQLADHFEVLGVARYPFA